MEGTIAEIRGFGGNFAPRAWAFCEGQLLAISSNQALFSLIGTTYGGDGRTTFGLPDLRGRAPISAGTGPGLTTRKLGSRGGVEIVTLTQNEMPTHTHVSSFTQTAGVVQVAAVDDTGNSDSPDGNNLAIADAGGASAVYSNGTPSTYLGAGSTATVTGTVTNYNAGGSQPHTNMQPYLTIHWIICLQGTFPSRS